MRDEWRQFCPYCTLQVYFAREPEKNNKQFNQGDVFVDRSHELSYTRPSYIMTLRQSCVAYNHALWYSSDLLVRQIPVVNRVVLRAILVSTIYLRNCVSALNQVTIPSSACHVH